MLPCNLPNRENQFLPNIKYLWFLLSIAMADLLCDEKKADKLTRKEIILKGSIIAIFLIIPSISAFFLSWSILDDLLQAAIIGGIIHFIAMGFSLKISNKFFAKERVS
jgi:ABC-type arginine transport system permease subunit